VVSGEFLKIKIISNSSLKPVDQIKAKFSASKNQHLRS
jgi:hypothetical protein